MTRPPLAAILLVVASASCAGGTTVITVGSPDGALDCAGGEIPRSADVFGEGETEQEAVELALADWLQDGSRLANPMEAEVWSAVLDGNEIAIALPEREGDGGWVVADVQACGQPDTGPAELDGSIDCTGETVWTQQAMIDADATGETTPEDAIRVALSDLAAAEGEIVMIDDNTGSLVVDGREQVVAFATEAPGGRWLASTLIGCDDPPG